MSVSTICPHCGWSLDRKPTDLTGIYGPDPEARRGPRSAYAVYEMIDPRDDSVIRVGVCPANIWLDEAQKSWSERTNRIVAELAEIGYAPRPHLITHCATRGEAMLIKLQRCQEAGLPFRGMSKNDLRGLRTRRQKARTGRQEGASA